MIKQIQLRGISRTPSDRMSEDGGLSESLNMYLDTAESAPAFVPEDVTEKLGLPADLGAERIFIHKTANYENYIAVHGGKVVAYTPQIEDEEPLLILELTDGEKVNDITSVGNTLILATTKNMYYVLYKDRAYSFLGNKIPFPHINFGTTEAESIDNVTVSVKGDTNQRPHDTELDKEAYLSENNIWFVDIPSESEWTKGTPGINSLKESLTTALNKKENEISKENAALFPVFLRYTIEVAGEKYSSMPILVRHTKYLSDPILVTSVTYEHIGTDFVGILSMVENSARITGLNKYKIQAHLNTDKEDLFEWRDLITKIKIYMSPMYPYLQEIKLEDGIQTTTGITDISETEWEFTQQDANVKVNSFEIDDMLFLSSQTRLIKEIDFLNESKSDFSEDFKSLMDGTILDIRKYIDQSFEEYTPLENQEILLNDDMQHYLQSANQLSTFNNKLILVNSSQKIDYDYNKLNASNVVDEVNMLGGGETIYDVTYILRGATEDKVVNKSFTYYSSSTQNEVVYAFQIFPDSRAYKMIVKASRKIGSSLDGPTYYTQYGIFDMQPHPYLDCAYYYGGIDNELIDLCDKDDVEIPSVNAIDDLDNKLLASDINKPFFFPLNSRYTFQSRIIGTATATTTLSQGQFGQFPLAVFTEDGIWMMQTNEEGELRSSKPKFRDVCINPDSITSIDNAIVFITARGVMMIQNASRVQEAQVVCISPYMNGKHYTPNDSALNLIRKQEGFDTLIEPINDDDPFMSFMKDAKVAYDYTGQRLVFISPSNDGFQYVYKIDTQTWHKVAFSELDLIAPLNSYPDCLVQGKVDDYSKLYWIINPIPSPSESVILETMQDFSSETNIHLSVDEVRSYLRGEIGIDVSIVNEEDMSTLSAALARNGCEGQVRVRTYLTKIYSLSTVLDSKPDPENPQKVAKGILITRPFDLGMPDVYKSIKSIKIRGDFNRDNVKFILQGSDNGKEFYTLTSLRGKSWKMFRIFILATLEPTERLSWIDIDFEPRYQNKLR